ncbi:MAG: hypothetical protein HKN35_04840 [Woeseia sp.]|nr:hypothetical protein [Woeseia sp.]
MAVVRDQPDANEEALVRFARATALIIVSLLTEHSSDENIDVFQKHPAS